MWRDFENRAFTIWAATRYILLKVLVSITYVLISRNIRKKKDDSVRFLQWKSGFILFYFVFYHNTLQSDFITVLENIC